MGTNVISYSGGIASTGRSTTPLVERLNNLNDKANTPMVCTKCGGNFFYKVAAEQYSAAGYGSVTFRSLSQSTESLFICVCGAVVENKESVGKGAIDRRAQFLTAVKIAVEAQKKNDPQIVAAQCASLDEVENLTARVAWLEQVIDQLLQEADEDEDEVKDETETPHVEEHTETISNPRKGGRPPKAKKGTDE